jgi:hypothetical protein
LNQVKELRHITRISYNFIFLLLFCISYFFIAFTDISKITPFFNWKLYTGLGQEFKIFDVAIYKNGQRLYLYQNIHDINKRRNFQKLISTGKMDKEYLTSLIKTYTIKEFDSFEIVERSIKIDQIINKQSPFIPTQLQ